MASANQTPTEYLNDDVELLDAAGWPRERVTRELSDQQIEEMIDVCLARGDDAVAGALSAMLETE